MSEVLNQNKKIDALLQQRQDGMFNFSQATKGLMDMGVKIGHQRTGEITLPESFKDYLDKFERSMLEFEWEVIYKDGLVLRQFSGDNQFNFSHIDQTKIKSVSYISNFTWPTDNQEKRIIVRLDWETGLFDFINGFASQEVKAKCCIDPLPGEKRLILFSRKRFSSAVGESFNEIKEFANMVDEFYLYHRFVLGYQVPGGNKLAIIIEPNGTIKLLDDNS